LPEVKEFLESFPKYKSNHDSGKYNITVPHPFKFDKPKQKLSIREQKLEADRRLKEIEHEIEMKPFKRTNYPVRSEEERQRERAHSAQPMAQDVMDNPPFQANPVPWYCKVAIY